MVWRRPHRPRPRQPLLLLEAKGHTHNPHHCRPRLWCCRYLVLLLLFAGWIYSILLEGRSDYSSDISYPTTSVAVVETEKYLVGTSSSTHSNQPIALRQDDYIYQYSWGGSPIVVEEYKLIFFTVPKVACTVWKQLFRRMMGYSTTWAQPNPHNPKTNGLTYLFHYNLTRASELLNDPDTTKAIFVRDPKSKFLSAYLDKALGDGGSHVYQKCCVQQKNRPSTTTKTNSNRHHSKYRPKECLKKAQESLEGFFEITETCSDTHRGLQSDRMGRQDEDGNNSMRLWQQLPFFVGHLEHVAEDAERLLRKLGAWESFGATGWGKYGNESIFASTSNVLHATLAKQQSDDRESSLSAAATATAVAQEVEDERRKAKFAKYYTPALESAVEQRFAKDYCLLGLTRRRIFDSNDGTSVPPLDCSRYPRIRQANK